MSAAWAASMDCTFSCPVAQPTCPYTPVAPDVNRVGRPVIDSAFWAISMPTSMPRWMLPGVHTARTAVAYSTVRLGSGVPCRICASVSSGPPLRNFAPWSTLDANESSASSLSFAASSAERSGTKQAQETRPSSGDQTWVNSLTPSPVIWLTWSVTSEVHVIASRALPGARRTERLKAYIAASSPPGGRTLEALPARAEVRPPTRGVALRSTRVQGRGRSSLAIDESVSACTPWLRVNTLIELGIDDSQVRPVLGRRLRELDAVPR